MGFIDTIKRVGSIMEANINALIDKAEDPEKMVDQLLRESRKALAEVKQDTAEVKAATVAAKKNMDEVKADVAERRRAAENALKAGEEDDARRLIEMMQKSEARLADLTAKYNAAMANEKKMVDAYNGLVQRISDLEDRAKDIKANAKLADAYEKTTAVAAKANAAAKGGEFDRFEKRINDRLATAEAMQELDAMESSDDDLVGKYASGGSATVEDTMAEMKARLGIV